MKYKYQESLDLTYEALDLLSIKEYLHKGWKLSDIMENIETYVSSGMFPIHFYTYMQEHYDFFRGKLFNQITPYEFLTYCTNRYPDIEWVTESYVA